MSVRAKDITLLSKSLLPLPEKFHGLQDKELRYRQRYVDLIVNPEVKRGLPLHGLKVVLDLLGGGIPDKAGLLKRILPRLLELKKLLPPNLQQLAQFGLLFLVLP